MAGRRTVETPKHRQGGQSHRGTASVGATRKATTTLPMLRTSERSTLKRCEFQWDLTYNRRVKNLTEMPALRFGSLIHKALAGYYIKGVKRGVHPAVGFKKAYDADMKVNREIFGMKVEDDEVWVNAEELGLSMMNNYVDEFGKDSNWEVLATEIPFQVVVMRPHSKDPAHPDRGGFEPEPWFVYTGVMDGVWRKRDVTKELWVPDHKSTKGIGPKTTRHLPLDDQAGAYWSWGVDFLVAEAFLKQNQQLSGMLYNFLRKALPDKRQSKFEGGKRLYLNLDGTVSKKQPSPYFLRAPVFRDEYDRTQAKRRAMNDYRRIEMLRSGELEISKNPGMFTCPMCPVFDICELHETGADWESFLKQTTKPWDPYAEHEVYDGR